MTHRIALGLGAAAAAAGTAGRAAAGRFAGRLAGYQAELAARPVSEVDPTGLPAVVRRWLDAVLPTARPRPAIVRLEQAIEMRVRAGRPWSPGTAVHLAAGGQPGFAWFGRVRLGPLLGVSVYDALVGSDGFLEARLWGVVPLARSHGSPTTRGQIQRYLAELPWTPLAVLTNPELRWRQSADSDDVVGVSATVRGVEGTVSLTFEDGLPTSAFAANRPRLEGRRVVERPWQGAFSAYRDFGGMRLPAGGEVAWQLDGKWSPYWRGTITDVSFPGTR